MKTKNRLVMLTVLMILSVLIVSACGIDVQASQDETPIPTVTADVDVIVEGNLVPADFLSIPVTLAGRVDEILVDEGETVQKGDVLLRLGDRENFEAAVTAAALELESAEQALEDLQENAALARSEAWLAMMDAEQALIDAEVLWEEFEDSTFEDDLEEAKMDVIDAEDELETAQEDLEQYESLDEDNTLRTNAEDALEDAERAYNDAIRARNRLLIDQSREEALLEQAQAVYEDAQRIYDARQNGPDPDDLALVEARLKNAQAQLSAAEAAFDNLEVTAPLDGVVVEINVSQDEQVTPGRNAILLADFSSWYVETRDLTELEVVKIGVGQGVVLAPDSLPELELRGTVESIADVYEERLGDINYKVRILLDETDPRLRWGMTVEATFITD